MKPATFSPEALRHPDEWKHVDSKMIPKIIALVIEISTSPFTGTGKPEPLKFELKGKLVKANQSGTSPRVRST